ncbi:MAG: dienelactone hydrolase family protein [Chloroflexi bacterium]|nr:dienelactone hydrolase family protein [Chloroflexota bacterium]
MNRLLTVIRNLLIALLCVLAAAAPTHAQSPKPLPKPSPTAVPPTEPTPEGGNFAIGQHAYTFTFKNGRRVQKLKYLLYLPESYGKDPYATFPLVVFLHGSRELGADITKLHNAILPARLDHEADFPAVVVSPQSPIFAWDSSVPAVSALLDDLQASLSIDPDRVYLTGLSMGAYGVWALAMKDQTRFAAIVSVVGGYYYNAKQLCVLKDIPVWVFAGKKDRNVNPKESIAIVDALRACGANPKFTLYEDADHDKGWTRAFQDPELFPWLLLQRLGAEG